MLILKFDKLKIILDIILTEMKTCKKFVDNEISVKNKKRKSYKAEKNSCNRNAVRQKKKLCKQ